MAEQDVNLNQVNGAALSSGNPVPVAGPVTSVDGGVVTIGALADSAYSGSGAASVVAILKGIYVQAKSGPISRAVVSVYGSNPTQTTSSAADTLFKWGGSGLTPVYSILLQNNTGAVVNFGIDATSVNGFTLQDKASVYIDTGAPISVLHLSSAAQQQINHASTPGINVQAWG